MLDEKEIDRAKKNFERLIKEGIVTKRKEKKFINFFLSNAKNSLDSAKLLFDVSTKNDLKDLTGFPDFNGFLWVVNSSYYSMFYVVRALLEKEGVEIKTDESIHAAVFGALIYYFYSTGKLQKKFIEEFAEANAETVEILGKEKAKELVEDYFHEKNKRGILTYEMGVIAMQNKAETSLDRAKKFNEEIRKIIETKK